MAPAPIDMVAFAPACLLEMTSPKEALEPKDSSSKGQLLSKDSESNEADGRR